MIEHARPDLLRGANSVAHDAHEIAFPDFRDDGFPIMATPRRDVELFCRRITVIEVHA
jgi:hypothetical protein